MNKLELPPLQEENSKPNDFEIVVNEFAKKLYTMIATNTELNRLEITLPANIAELNVAIRLDFLQKLSSCSPFECIGDKVFVKCDNMRKSFIHNAIRRALESQGAWSAVLTQSDCVVNDNKYIPDVGAWKDVPSDAELDKSTANRCRAPNVWVEVVYNNDHDRDAVIKKFEDVRPFLPETEFILVVLKNPSSAPHPPKPSLQPMPTPATPHNDRPHFAPYIGYWRQENAVKWFFLVWDQYLQLNATAKLEFNPILFWLMSAEERARQKHQQQTPLLGKNAKEEETEGLEEQGMGIERGNEGICIRDQEQTNDEIEAETQETTASIKVQIKRKSADKEQEVKGTCSESGNQLQKSARYK